MVAVSIVTYKTPDDEVRKCIDTLLQCPEVTRIDIVDNSAQERIQWTVESYKSRRINYIACNNNGFGAGHNISIAKSLEDSSLKYHLVINSDIVFSSDTITQTTAIMDADERIGMATPMVLDASGREQSSYHPLPRYSDLIFRRFFPALLTKKRIKEYNILVGGRQELLNVPYIHGCFMMMRLEALRVTGIFDERYFMYPEDIDLSRRIREKYAVAVIPNFSIIHYHRGESRKNMKMLRIHIINMIRYFNKWGWHQNKARLLYYPSPLEPIQKTSVTDFTT